MINDTRSILLEKRGLKSDIAGDTLSLYISNNPRAATWLAEYIGDSQKVVLELCCGVGVTLESLVQVFKLAIGVDNNKEVLDACRKNLEKNNLFDRTKLILGDVRSTDLLKSLKADVVVYDIPYWYPEKYPMYSPENKLGENPDLKELIENINKYIGGDIIIFAPREMGYEYFKDIVKECECLEIIIDGKHDRNYVFLGGLVRSIGSRQINI